MTAARSKESRLRARINETPETDPDYNALALELAELLDALVSTFHCESYVQVRAGFTCKKVPGRFSSSVATSDSEANAYRAGKRRQMAGTT